MCISTYVCAVVVGASDGGSVVVGEREVQRQHTTKNNCIYLQEKAMQRE